ncbi:MAG: hypothetical protein ACR2P0_14040 [Acidimicrobiales bacterium]
MEISGILAHGVGSRGTLPLPLWQFSWAAIAALVLSFVALGALWKTPRLAPAADGWAVPGTQPLVRIGRWVLRLLGLILFGLTLGAALFGADVGGEAVNLAPVTIYVIVWVGVAVVAALLGDFWRALNPFRTIGLLFPEETDRHAPRHVWWATGTLFGFLILELVHPSGDSPRVLGWSMLVYTALMIAGMARYGRVWLDRADGFGVLFSLIAAIAPIWVDDDDRIRLRPPMSGLSRAAVLPGTALLILTVLGGTSFDGFSESPIYTDIIGRPTGWAAALPNLIGLVVMIAIAAVLYWTGARTTASVTGVDHAEAAHIFSPSLMPIVWGYAVAHYAQLLVDQTQSFWFRLSNPYGRFDPDGAPSTNVFGAADGAVDFTVIDVDLVAWVQALAIVVGHVLAVTYAHEIAVARFDARDAARSQQTMLVVMVLYSVAGLWLLFAG